MALIVELLIPLENRIFELGLCELRATNSTCRTPADYGLLNYRQRNPRAGMCFTGREGDICKTSPSVAKR